jgi:parallel beta-helix repeat protein
MEIKAFRDGISVSASSNIIISGNTITNTSWAGIYLYASSNITISGNNITNNDVHGIVLSDSSSNTISGNDITNNDSYGIWLQDSSNNTLRDNSIANNKYNFDVSGSSLSDFVNDIDPSNTVDGKPVYYWINRQDMTVPLDAGYVALVNCTRITLQNLNLTNNGFGAIVAHTTSSTLTKNDITNNFCGIGLYESSNNTVSENNITNNSNYGLLFSDSSNNTLSGKTITKPGSYGVYLSASSSNTFRNNSIVNNLVGIDVDDSSNNIIYHNNFLDNTYHVMFVDGLFTPNVWDNGYTSGGNYWSGYTDVDQYSGPYQNEAGGDGVWDHPYVIGENNQDNYPMAPATSPAYFTDTYSAAGVDLDNNGLLEYLVFTIEVNVNVGGTYTVGIWNLLDSSGNPLDASNSISSYLELGVQNVSVPISGPKIFSSGVSGPYTISYLYLEDSVFNLVDSRYNPYTTINAYSTGDFEEGVSAGDLTVAMGFDPADVIDTTFSVDKIAGAVVYGSVGFLAPTEGNTFVMLSTGNAQPEDYDSYGGWVGAPDDFISVDNGNPSGTGPLGGEANDLAILHLTLKAPDWAKSLSFDFRFMSEEYPEFVGSDFNDFFSCLLDGTNIAFDTEGNIINVNNNFFDDTITPEGTVFDGTTVLLTSKAAVTGGATIELDFIVGDITDSYWDTTVFLDNFHFSTEEIEEPVTAPTIWSSDSSENEKNTFAPTETVYVTVPATGKTVTFYILADKDVWNNGDPLIDVSDGTEQLTLNHGPGSQVVQVWGAPLTPGSYDVVEDANNNGVYDGVDGIDSVAEIGFVVEYPPVNNPPYQPQLSITPSLAVEDNDDLIATVTGPTPSDPDGDSVTYTYRWLVDVGTGQFVDDEVAGMGDHTGNMVPAADTAVGDIWRVEVTPQDEH